MTIGDFLDLARDGITVLLLTVGPIMGISLAVGLTVALFQALTQIQEMIRHHPLYEHHPQTQPHYSCLLEK